ncbi:alpha/beta-hydrolase [Tothia fuscella]|uniref:Alpha/beta-hydrolase n=1 Tax=Tothia fuscella TaxID=1048955 RepID=A0A9P4NWG5_9PEZI|nr:alpha/beta-hydrolase [Tothia fuscella]
MLGITDGDFNTLNLYSQYAAASYCYSNNGNAPAPDPRINCSGAFSLNNRQSNCPLVERNGATVISPFTGGVRNTTGFVGVDDQARVIMASFRGSEFTRAFVADNATNVDSLNSQVSISNYCFNCTAARGYFEAWSSVKDTVANLVRGQIDRLKDQNPPYQVVITGHSLGGAIATFAALELRRTFNINVHLATFGMPRVGNKQLVQYLSSFDPTTNASTITVNPRERNYRVTHLLDFIPDSIGELVPTLPPARENSHITPNFKINKAEYMLPNKDDVTIADGISQNNGGNFIFSGLFPGRHGFYFGNISACF